MVKIKKLLVFGLVFIFMLQLVYAADNSTKLDITKLDVTVDGSSDKDLTNGELISKDAKPGSTVKVKVKVENMFTSDEKLEIQDVLVSGTIEGIDDGDDLEEEGNEFDLRQGRSKTETLTFEIPKKVDEDEYTLTIIVEGEDENNTLHELEWDLRLEVKKEKHAIEIEKTSLRKETIGCDEATTLEIKATNYGRDDEEDVTVEIVSSALEIDLKEEEIELTNDLFDEDSTYERTVTIKADGMDAGTYPIEINVYYDGDRLDDSKSVNLVIKECVAPVTTDEEDEEEQVVGDDTSFIVNLPDNSNKDNTIKDDTVTVYATPTGDAALNTAEKSSNTATYVLIAAVGIVLLLVVFAALLGVVLILKR